LISDLGRAGQRAETVTGNNVCMPHVDPALIDKAANNVMSEPLAYMQVAQEYLEKDCKGNVMMFGACGVPFMSWQYSNAHENHLNNVKAGVDKIKEMANGLSYTAAHWAKAEVANTPTGSKTDVKYKKPDDGSYVANASEFAALYWAASLAACRLVAEGTLMACGALAPAAMANWNNSLVRPDTPAVVCLVTLA